MLTDQPVIMTRATMSPRVPVDEREEQLQERRKQILKGAIEAFSRQDLAGGSVPEITKAAGIAHFRPKERGG